MATSGTFSKVFSTGYTYKCSWSAVQDVGNNKSTITTKHYLVLSSNYTISSSATKSIECTIDGTKKSITKTGISGSGTTISLGTTTHTVYHESDGSKSCAFSSTFNIAVTLSGTYYSSITASGTLKLDTIAGASALSYVTSSVSMSGSSAVTIKIKPQVTGCTHKLTYSFGDKSTSVTLTDEADSDGYIITKYTIPISWNNEVPSATSGTASVSLATYISSKQVGSSVSKTFTVTVPTTIVPSFTALSIAKGSDDVPSSWGVYVKGKSKAVATITGASGSYSSTIKTYSISGGGYSSSAKTLSTGYLSTSGSNVFTAKITDSRGRTATKTTTITVYDYAKPTFSASSISIYRCNSVGTQDLASGKYVRVKATYSYSSCNNKNSVTAKVTVNGTSTTISSATNYTLGKGNLDIANSYDIVFSITDSFGESSTITKTLPSVTRAINISSDNRRVAIGGLADDDGEALQVYGDIKVNNTVLSGVQGGTVYMDCVANTTVSQEVVFDTAFNSTPFISLVASSVVPAYNSLSYGSISATGFTIYMHRTSTATVAVRWLAIAT